MENEELIRFLMHLAGVVVQLHRESRQDAPGSNAGPRFGENVREAFDEGFARWMGFRGPDEQEREIRNIREL